MQASPLVFFVLAVTGKEICSVVDSKYLEYYEVMIYSFIRPVIRDQWPPENRNKEYLFTRPVVEHAVLEHTRVIM